LPNYAINVQNVSKNYNNSLDGIQIIALKKMSLQIQENTFSLLTGSNGIGKTTLMSILSGLSKPSTGSGTILGESILGRIDKQQIGFAPDLLPRVSNITINEFFKVIASMRHTENERWRDLITLFQMDKWVHKPLHWCSIGMLKRISLITAFFHEPKLVLLDEPLENLDNNGKEILAELLLKSLNHGATTLMTSHIVKEPRFIELKPNYIDMEDLFSK